MRNLLAISGCFWLALAVAPAAAENSIRPGLWKVTSNTVMNGARGSPQVKTPCVTVQQAADVVGTFNPDFGTVNANCERTEYETNGKTLRWRLQCRGHLDMDVAGNMTFDSPNHYSATILAKGWMAGSLITNTKSEMQGQRVGECKS